jgi:ABC-type spermidine/putrescine transport system permease subunit II
MKKALKRYWAVFVLPTLAAFVIGFVVPFVQGLYLTFCKFVTIDKATFVGLRNYAYAFKDASFGHSLWFTAAFAVLSTVLINVIALAIALALTRNMKGANIHRTVFFMPNLIGGIVLGYIWLILLNCALSLMGKNLIALNATYGFWGLIILMCWQQIGYMMIIYIAGLQSIPSDYLEAAKIDGANGLADPVEGEDTEPHVLHHHLPVLVHDQRLQALRPEPGPHRRRPGPCLRDAGPEHLQHVLRPLRDPSGRATARPRPRCSAYWSYSFP